MHHPATTTHSRRQLFAWSAGAALVAAGLARPVLGRQSLVEGATAFLDPATIHELAITFDQATYDTMVKTFADTGKKEWMEATVVIDGATYERAGIRLKGNSSLGMLGGMPELPGGDGGTPAALPEGEGQEAVPAGTPAIVTEEGRDTVVAGPGNGAGAETPELLPWLVKLDRNVDGQNHQGLHELVVRSNLSKTSLNEAVALDLLDLAGLASQRGAYARFRANESEVVLRFIVEHPDDVWMRTRFPNGGFLYKAEAGGSWDYLGDDPEAYKDSFDLEAGKTGDDAADMQSLFTFLKFVNESDDATFESTLSEYLDVDRFATYLAMMGLIENWDDIRGPGNNAYLHVDPGSTQMVVVPWDMNLAFGGGMSVRNGERPLPNLEDLPDDAEVWVNGTPVAGGDGDGPDVQIVGPGFTDNPFLERWDKVTAFTDRVTAEHDRLKAELYTGNVASQVLARWVGVLKTHASDMVDADTIATEASPIQKVLQEQT